MAPRWVGFRVAPERFRHSQYENITGTFGQPTSLRGEGDLGPNDIEKGRPLDRPVLFVDARGKPGIAAPGKARPLRPQQPLEIAILGFGVMARTWLCRGKHAP